MNEIKKIENVICIYHSIDLDGWMSSAIVRLYFEKKHKEIVVIDLDSQDQTPLIDTRKENSRDYLVLSMKGYNYGDRIPNLNPFSHVVMCDISLPKKEMSNLRGLLGNNFTWIDHHISAMKEMKELYGEYYHSQSGIRNTAFAACELTWQYFFPEEKMPKIVHLLGRYDCFGHKGTEEEQEVLEFQYGARGIINDNRSAYDWLVNGIEVFNENDIEKYGRKTKYISIIQEKGKIIHDYLCSEARNSYKNGFLITFHIDDACYKFICFNKERFNPINFGINYHADGYDGAACFHYANGQYNFSLYNDNGEVDCSVIAKLFGGGGHKGASGFRIEDLSQIIK